jgi:hypothetical protein
MSFLEKERRRHERRAAQSALYIGLYDGGSDANVTPGHYVPLNPMCREEDPTSQRFALVEID